MWLSPTRVTAIWTLHLKHHMVCLSMILLFYRIVCLWFCNNKGVICAGLYIMRHQPDMDWFLDPPPEVSYCSLQMSKSGMRLDFLEPGTGSCYEVCLTSFFLIWPLPQPDLEIRLTQIWRANCSDKLPPEEGSRGLQSKSCCGRRWSPTEALVKQAAIFNLSHTVAHIN